MLHFYSPATSPTGVGKYGPATFFPKLLEVFADDSAYRIHESIPEDPNLITHLLLRLSTPNHLLKSNSPLSFHDQLGTVERSMLSSGRWKLLLDLGWEMLPTRAEFTQQVTDEFDRSNIPPEQVWILNSNLTSEDGFRRAAGSANQLNILPFPVGAFIFLSHHRIDEAAAFDHYVEAEKNARTRAPDRRHFLNFNGRARPHRNYLVAFLMANDLLEKGFVSLLAYQRAARGSGLVDFKDTDTLETQYRRQCWGWPHSAVVAESYSRLASSLPLELDLTAEDAVKDARYKVVTPWQLQDPDLYRRSFFSIVTDTAATGDGLLFVTEKVFKPMTCLHPFIYMGHHGALAVLRSLGFQTFGPFFNEAYDDEPNGYTRIGMVLDEIKRLCALSEGALSALFDQLWPRIVHNARHSRLEGMALGQTEFCKKVMQRLLAPA